MADKGRRYGQAFRLSPEAVGTDRRSWAQVLRTGKWWDERYGWFEVAKEHLDAIARNFGRERKVLYADYDHGIALPDGSGRALAAGQILQVEVRAGEGTDERGKPRHELWALVEWTERAAAAIRAREYNHTSAWYAPQFKNNQGEELGPTLLGFAITNRPVIDGMAPLALDERASALALSSDFIAFGERLDSPGPTGQDEGRGKMNLAFLLGRLGLGPSATETDAAAKVDELQGQVRTLSAEKQTVTSERDREKSAREAAERTLSEIRTVFGFGTEGDLLAHCRTLSAKLKEAETKGRDQEVTALVERALREHRILPTQKDYFLSKLKEEAAGAKLEETPTTKLLGALPPNPAARQAGIGGTQAQTAAGAEDATEMDRLFKEHLKDPDVVELSKTDRNRAILLANERAAEDLDKRARSAASA